MGLGVLLGALLANVAVALLITPIALLGGAAGGLVVARRAAVGPVTT